MLYMKNVQSSTTDSISAAIWASETFKNAQFRLGKNVIKHNRDLKLVSHNFDLKPNDEAHIARYIISQAEARTEKRSAVVKRRARKLLIKFQKRREKSASEANRTRETRSPGVVTNKGKGLRGPALNNIFRRLEFIRFKTFLWVHLLVRYPISRLGLTRKIFPKIARGRCFCCMNRIKKYYSSFYVRYGPINNDLLIQCLNLYIHIFLYWTLKKRWIQIMWFWYSNSIRFNSIFFLKL